MQSRHCSQDTVIVIRFARTTLKSSIIWKEWKMILFVLLNIYSRQIYYIFPIKSVPWKRANLLEYKQISVQPVAWDKYCSPAFCFVYPKYFLALRICLVYLKAYQGLQLRDMATITAQTTPVEPLNDEIELLLMACPSGGGDDDGARCLPIRLPPL